MAACMEALMAVEKGELVPLKTLEPRQRKDKPPPESMDATTTPADTETSKEVALSFTNCM